MREQRAWGWKAGVEYLRFPQLARAFHRQANPPVGLQAQQSSEVRPRSFQLMCTFPQGKEEEGPALDTMYYNSSLGPDLLNPADQRK